MSIGSRMAAHAAKEDRRILGLGSRWHFTSHNVYYVNSSAENQMQRASFLLFCRNSDAFAQAYWQRVYEQKECASRGAFFSPAFFHQIMATSGSWISLVHSPSLFDLNWRLSKYDWCLGLSVRVISSVMPCLVKYGFVSPKK